MLANGILFLEKLGLYDVILPFILIFTITYLTLDHSKILGENSNNYNTMAAFVMGFITVSSINIVANVNYFMMYTALFIMAIFFVMVITAATGVDFKVDGKITKWFALGAIVIGFTVIVLSRFRFWENINLPMGIITSVAVTILSIGSFFLIIWWITREKKEK